MDDPTLRRFMELLTELQSMTDDAGTQFLLEAVRRHECIAQPQTDPSPTMQLSGVCPACYGLGEVLVATGKGEEVRREICGCQEESNL